MRDFINDNFTTILKAIVVIFIIVLFFIHYINNSSNDYVEMTSEDKMKSEIEELKHQNNLLKDNLSNVKSQLEDLQKEHNHDEELIDLLQEQLLNYGIEPVEL